MRKFFYIVMMLCLTVNLYGGDYELFKASDSSLLKYKCPEWFRDAKFGIWAHWGPQAVARMGDWYAKQMYKDNSPLKIQHIG